MKRVLSPFILLPQLRGRHNSEYEGWAKYMRGMKGKSLRTMYDCDALVDQNGSSKSKKRKHSTGKEMEC